MPLSEAGRFTYENARGDEAARILTAQAPEPQAPESPAVAVDVPQAAPEVPEPAQAVLEPAEAIEEPAADG
jgi:hypothetical protein